MPPHLIANLLLVVFSILFNVHNPTLNILEEEEGEYLTKVTLDLTIFPHLDSFALLSVGGL